MHPALVQLHGHTAAIVRRRDATKKHQKKNRKVALQSSLPVASLTHSGLLVFVLLLDLEVTLFSSLLMIAIFFLFLKLSGMKASSHAGAQLLSLAETTLRNKLKSSRVSSSFCFLFFCVCMRVDR